MATLTGIVVLDSRYEAAARCTVCGNEIAEGEGVTARFAGRTLRFKCPGCLGRFEADPDRYLSGHQSGCCGNEAEHSPASEWRCD